MNNTERIYTGIVKEVKKLNTNELGMITYSLTFKSGNKVYYQVSNKQTMNIKAGDKINFSGDFHKRFFLITNTFDYSQKEIQRLQQQEIEKKRYVESNNQYDRVNL